uniref:Uncharacterized protein n=1 Tax=Clytia hemisphaerica TaxID=252671 RepID=A0A7M5XFM5_9CNID
VMASRRGQYIDYMEKILEVAKDKLQRPPLGPLHRYVDKSLLGKHFNYYIVHNGVDFGIILEEAEKLNVYQPNMIIFDHDVELSPDWFTLFPGVECPPAVGNVTLQYLQDPTSHM